VNPNFLLIDDLQYEFCSSGISCEGNTGVLCKLLRLVILRQFTFYWDYLKSVSVDEWCACTDLNICELQSLVKQALPSLLFVGPRVRTRLFPFVGPFASF
jgi:hypothetical protein